MQARKIEAGPTQRLTARMANFTTGNANGFVDADLQDHTAGHSDLATGAT